MLKSEKLDLTKTPDALKEGDIIGFDSFPQQAAGQVRSSSSLKIQDFKACAESPKYRGMVLARHYDPRDNDRITHVTILPIAPVPKGIVIDNTDKNLMITRAGQLRAMGLDGKTFNWRLNYQPVTLPLNPRTTGIAKPDTILKFGKADDTLHAIVFGHAQRLMEQDMLLTVGILPPSFARQLRGERANPFDKIAGGEVGSRHMGNRRDTEAAEEAARRERERRKEEKKAAAIEARNEAKQMRTTPSGKEAFKLGLRFTEVADPDITLEQAHALDLLDEELHLILDTLSEITGNTTLRTAYDSFVQDHEDTMDNLVLIGACNEDKRVSYKADLEEGLKTALTAFYAELQKGKKNSLPPDLEEALVPYSRPAPKTL